MLQPKFGSILTGGSGEKIFFFEEIYQVNHFDSHVTRKSFAIPVTNQERNVAAKFHLDRPSHLAGEVEKGDGWHAMTIPNLECKFLIS